jgi:hypothetical protein
MITDFQAVPQFNNGQAISASDLNALLYNNSLIERIANSNQPLFMMSHAYSPTFLPASWLDSDYNFWEGSFLYREGMRYAYIGFWYKLENALDITNEFALGNLRGDPSPTQMALHICASLNSKERPVSYSNTGVQYFAFADASRALTTNTTGTTTEGKEFQHTITIREGAGSGSQSTQVNAGQTYITPNSRVSTVRMDIGNMGFSDGEIVTVRLWIGTYSRYATYFDQFASIRDVLRSNTTNPGSIPGFFDTYFINYGVLYAQTDGDLSYTANWPSTNYSGTLSQNDLGIITKKQSYIKERIQQRPRPLTGSIVYIGTRGGTASLFYPKGDHNLGDPDYTKENYWMPRSSTTFEPMYADSVNMVTGYNINSCLASFSWNPYLSKYDTIYFDMRFFGRGNTRQVLLADLAEQPTGLSSFRRVRRADDASKLYPYILGDVISSDANSSFYGAYGSASALSAGVEEPYNAARFKTYLNKAFNVRIPSPYTPVYSPELQVYSNQNNARTNYYLASGLWEDSIPIRFTEDVVDGIYTSWGLFKSDNQTVQFGFRSDLDPAIINSTFPLEIPVPNGERFYAHSYQAIYNGPTWKWVTANGVRGYAPVFINLYDHSGTDNVNKENYTSFIHVFGMSTGSPEYRDYATPVDYSAEQQLTYSGLVNELTSIHTELNTYYTELFSVNPYFSRYDMFWGAPKSPTDYMPLLTEYKEKFFYFSGQRQGNYLILRGKDVTMYWGEVEEVNLTDEIKGSLYPASSVNLTFSDSTGLISGDTEETVIVNLDALGIPLGSRYHLQGEVIYAAEFFEEPL